MQEVRKEAPPHQVWARRWAIYAALGIPTVNTADWRLKIGGLVANPLEFTYEQLLSMPQVKLVRDFHCVTQWSIADVWWEGVPFRRVAEMAQVKPEAEWVMFSCVDGYTAPIPPEDAMVDDCLIAFRMNGKPLPVEQGFPARPFMPHLYGWKSAKWLNGIEFMQDYVDGYWEMYGYHEAGNVWEEERFKGHRGRHSIKRATGTRPI